MEGQAVLDKSLLQKGKTAKFEAINKNLVFVLSILVFGFASRPFLVTPTWV